MPEIEPERSSSSSTHGGEPSPGPMPTRMVDHGPDQPFGCRMTVSTAWTTPFDAMMSGTAILAPPT